jgi:hypothetical protein
MAQAVQSQISDFGFGMQDSSNFKMLFIEFLIRMAGASLTDVLPPSADYSCPAIWFFDKLLRIGEVSNDE